MLVAARDASVDRFIYAASSRLIYGKNSNFIMAWKIIQKAQRYITMIEQGRHSSTFNSYWMTYIQDGRFTYERFNFLSELEARKAQL